MASLIERLLRPDAEGISTYNYEAVSASGRRVKSTMTAPSAGAVSAALQGEGWTPVSITARQGGVNVDLSQLWESRPVKFGVVQRAEFARQLYQMIDAGISSPRAINSLGDQAEPRVEAMCADIASQMSAGVPMSEAMASYPKAFDQVFCAVIRSGERAGTLEQTLQRLSDLLRKAAEMRNKIKGVTAYPKIVAIAIGLIVTGILAFMVPMFADIYASFGAELPAPTRFVVAASRQLPWILAVLAVLFIGVRQAISRYGDEPEWARRLDLIRFKVPVFGTLNHKRVLFSWSQILSGALAAGVALYEALELAADASGSRWMKLHQPQLSSAVREGRNMTEEMADVPDLYPRNIQLFVKVGEETGDIPGMLDSVTRSLDSDIDQIVSTLGAKIEVLLLIVLGVIVGGLLAVLYLPILNLANTVMSGLGG